MLLFCELHQHICFLVAGFELRYSGVGREYVADNLEPGHMYKIRVAGVAAEQQSEVCICVSDLSSKVGE